MEKQKIKHEVIDRIKFLEARYERYLLKDKALRGLGLRESVSMVDLDSYCPEIDEAYRMLCLCDRCGKNIQDDDLILIDSFVYHSDCIGIKILSNVVRLFPD